MSLSGVYRKRLSQREGMKNSKLPSAVRPLEKGPVDPKMTGIHGGGNTTKINVYGATGKEADCKCHQAQGKDPNIGNEKFDRGMRSHVTFHSGQGPNCGYGKK